MCGQSDSASDCSWWNSPSPFKSVSLCLFSFLLPLLFSLHLFITVWRLKEILLILWNEGRVSGMDRIVRGVMIGRRAWSVACVALMNGDRRGSEWRWVAGRWAVQYPLIHLVLHRTPTQLFFSLCLTLCLLYMTNSRPFSFSLQSYFHSPPVSSMPLDSPFLKKIGWLIAVVWLIWPSYNDK